MKLVRSAVFTILMIVWAVCVQAQNRSVSVTALGLPLKTVLGQLQEQSGYTIIYSDEVVLDSMTASVDAQRQPMSAVLNRILSPHGLFYTNRTGQLIVIGSTRLRDQIRDGQQPERELEGWVSDADEKPVPYASVTIMEQGRMLSGTAGENNGRFRILYAFEPGKRYSLQVSSVGYKTGLFTIVFSDTLKLQPLVLEKDKSTLNVVTVAAFRPLVERRADRFIVNVEGTPLADGNNALEVLQKAPGIWVDPDGAIKIQGNGSVTVMINDVVQRMSGSDLAEFLRTIRSENIKKIEVIANPPAEYEASGTGGIVHIILKKARDEGFTGQLTAVYKQQKGKPYLSAGISAQYKVRRFYFFGNGSLSKEEQVYYARTINSYKDNSTYDGITDRINNNRQFSYQGGVVYDISGKQSLSFQGGITGVDLLRNFKTGITLKDSTGKTVAGNSVTDWRRTPRLLTGTLNYSYKLDTLGSVFKILGDYMKGKKTENMQVASAYTDPLKDTLYRNRYPSNTAIYSGQADYLHYLTKVTRLQTGLKYVATERDNTITTEQMVNDVWVVNKNASNQFIYDENLLMGYAAMETSIKQTSVKLGLRAEETYMKGNNITSGQQFSRKYLNLFPSVFLLQQLNDQPVPASLSFSYSRRIRRPQFGDLNPFRLRIGDYSVMVGNPDLLPEYSDNYRLGYNFWKGYTLTLQYQRTNNIIAEFANPQEDGVIEYQTRNFKYRTSYGASLYAPVKITKWWTANVYSGLFYTAYVINDIQFAQTAFTLNTYQTFTLKRNFDAALATVYNSPYVVGNTRNATMFITDCSFGKKFFDNKLRLRLNFTDVFNTFREKSQTTYNGVKIDFYQKRPTRTIGISVNYLLNAGKKIKDKKIELSAEEEKSRI
ncbi:TonB-dependent receptor [Niabella sp. CC-SYL272]|uniref:outer membrane beta-barrel protein n=1 Tax=Niabella agricola TaxID=2891571 RepID=UPI001F3208A9|nr:outer membrane beta-barrel protein [Niabella agricola]MCF3109644.1 TonB-dependent receptor [Niabella agricola]